MIVVSEDGEGFGRQNLRRIHLDSCYELVKSKGFAHQNDLSSHALRASGRVESLREYWD